MTTAIAVTAACLTTTNVVTVVASSFEALRTAVVRDELVDHLSPRAHRRHSSALLLWSIHDGAWKTVAELLSSSRAAAMTGPDRTSDRWRVGPFAARISYGQQDDHIAARIVGTLFVAGPSTGEVWLAMERPRLGTFLVLLGIGVAAQLSGLLVLRYRARLSRRLPEALLLVSPLIVAGLVVIAGSSDLALATFFVWCAAAAAAVLDRRALVAFAASFAAGVLFVAVWLSSANGTLFLSVCAAALVAFLIRDTLRETRLRERTMRRGFDASVIGIALVGLDGRYIDVNPALCSMLGRTREELLRMGPLDITDPGDVERSSELTHEIAVGASNGFTLEKRYVRRDGSTLWAHVFGTRIDDRDGRPSFIFAQVVDVTAERAERERARSKAREADTMRMLIAALETGRGLELHGQPIVDLATGETVSHELLIRLRTEDRLLLPDNFLQAAESYGLVGDLDAWVARQAAAHVAAGSKVSINISARSISDRFMPARIEGFLSAAGAEPAFLMIEITETAVGADLQQTMRFVETLREIGCTVALDDFGTGYATLQMLKLVPVTCLKIDKRFIRDLATSKESQSVLDALVMISKRLGHTLIAEGIEDAATLALARDMGIGLGQGYHFGKPEHWPAPVVKARVLSARD